MTIPVPINATALQFILGPATPPKPARRFFTQVAPSSTDPTKPAPFLVPNGASVNVAIRSEAADGAPLVELDSVLQAAITISLPAALTVVVTNMHALFTAKSAVGNVAVTLAAP